MPIASSEPPPLLQRFLARTVRDGERHAARVRFEQVGEMQLRPGRWTPFRATQESRLDRVEFDWRATFRIGPLLRIRVVDWYREGEGALEARLFGLVPVMRSSGEAVAKGEAVRYLAEIPWFPCAVTANAELEWRGLDERSVEVATHVAGERTAVRLLFDAAGDIVASSADARPRMEGKEIVERPFGGSFGDHAELAGVRVPTSAEVYWELPEGRFPYFRARITDYALA